MMAKLKEILAIIETICPKSLQESYDNSGLQIGNPESSCHKILLALDFREDVLAEAIEEQADLIITHHPLLFQPLHSIDGSKGKGRLIYDLIEKGLALLSLHTNLDKAPFGVNVALADRLGLIDREILCPEEDTSPPEETEHRVGLGCLGRLEEPQHLADFADKVKETLLLPVIKYTGNAEKRISSVAVLGGSGASMMEEAAKMGADAFVSGDFKYHDGDKAAELGLALIDAGHYGTEVGVLEPLAEKLRVITGMEILISKKCKDIWAYH